jgi:putative ABC transport system permease protein
VSAAQRARLWAVWALRDARRRGLQVVSIGLLLALGVGMYTALTSMSSWRTRSADASLAASRMHDLRVALVPGSVVAEGALRGALDGIPGRAAVVGADERLVVPTQVDASTRTRSIRVSGRLVGMPVAAQVDLLSPTAGRALRGSDAGSPVAELERAFARHYDLPASGSVTVTGGKVLRIVGQAQAPEYFVVTAPGADFGAEATFAVLFAPLATVQRTVGAANRVNELVVRLAPGASAATVERRLTAALRRSLPGVGFTVTRGADEPAPRMLYKDAEGDQRMMDVFAWLLLAAATLGAANLVSRAVEAQRREIGIGMALGVPRAALARRPFLLGGQIALLGVVLGIPVGIAASAWLRSVVTAFFPLPVVQTPFAWSTFARGAALGVMLPLLATAFPVWRALRVRPIEAIRVGERAAARSGLARLARGVRLPGGTLANMPLRNVLRTPRRTATTLVGITGVVAILVALQGTLDSFNATVDAGRTEAVAGAPGRLTVDLATLVPASSPAVEKVTGVRAVGGSQLALRVPVTLAHGRRRIDAALESVPSRAPLRRPPLREGSLATGAPGIAVAARAARDLQVHVGDTVAVRHPVPGGETFAFATTMLRVTALDASPFRFVAYANDAAVAQMHLTGLVNRISVVPATGRTGDDVKRAMLAIPSVSAVQGATELPDAVDEQLRRFDDVIVVSAGIALAMALLIAYNTSAINVDARLREHATMFAFGVSPPRVLAGGVAEASMIGVAATAAGIVAGRALLGWIVNGIMAETLPDVGSLLRVQPFTYALAAVAGIAVVALAPLATIRRIRRVDVPSALRVVE